ncbi:uncharacterized protein H6S33_000168 [Morchella sextelata]|uniref:uncharacterized protein n=1 Tax=Morchella sextelata TaxID=1174677 RepID=UPI001D0556D0|nr:uncharacterized protein H6S33_000168 [Morchella sextelata]KAH0614532.1 hypothetical protein H6S33_000168 [Morchella sextelata]
MASSSALQQLSPPLPIPASPPPRVRRRFKTLIPAIFTHNKPTEEADALLVSIVRDMFMKSPFVDPSIKATILEVILGRIIVPNVPYTAESIVFQGVQPGGDMIIPLTFERKERLVAMFIDTYMQAMTYLGELKNDTAVVTAVHPTMLTPRPTCEITHAQGPLQDPQPVPILPMLSTSAGSKAFWRFLALIWPHSVVDIIQAHCADEATLGNSIVMSAECRRAWDAMEFYLLPLSGTYDRLRVSFHWNGTKRSLRNYKSKPQVDIDLGGGLVYEQMKEGKIITLKAGTDDDPLPDPGLVYVRAVLTKMAIGMEVTAAQRLLFDVGLADCGCEDDGEGEAAVEMDHRGCWVGRDNWFDDRFRGTGIFPNIWEDFSGLGVGSIQEQQEQQASEKK